MLKFAAFQTLEAKVARTGHGLMKDAHRHAFNYTPRKGYLYARSRAISSRCNDNFDEFPAEEIAAGYRTFIGKPVFVNHHNANHRRARGVIVDAVLHSDLNADGSLDTWVEVLMEIDAIRFPLLAKAIITCTCGHAHGAGTCSDCGCQTFDGQISRTSMGCDVAYSKCSFCGNKAVSPVEYCDHIRRHKGRRIRRRTASGDGMEDVLVREICYGLRFFENSVLVEDPADPTAYFLGVELGDDLVEAGQKTASVTADRKTQTDVWDAEDEQLHPRDDSGKFTDSGSTGPTRVPDGKKDTAPTQMDEGDEQPDAAPVTHGPTTAPAAESAAPAEVPAEQHVYEAPDGTWTPHPDTKGTGTAEDPVVTGSIEDAAKALSLGLHVELHRAPEVSTLLDRLAQMIEEAKASGNKLNIDLCNVTVQGTNLFCIESKGIPRSMMPQLKSLPEGIDPNGRVMREVQPNSDGEYDIQPHFLQHLKDLGYTAEEIDYPASYLKATQNQLNAGKVAGITNAILDGVNVNKEPIFVSEDDYIVDGHHRWAGSVSADWSDGDVGDVTMPVWKIKGLDIITLLDLANKFAAEWGFKQQDVAANNGGSIPGVKTSSAGCSNCGPSLEEMNAHAARKTAARVTALPVGLNDIGSQSVTWRASRTARPGGYEALVWDLPALDNSSHTNLNLYVSPAKDSASSADFEMGLWTRMGAASADWQLEAHLLQPNEGPAALYLRPGSGYTAIEVFTGTLGAAQDRCEAMGWDLVRRFYRSRAASKTASASVGWHESPAANRQSIQEHGIKSGEGFGGENLVWLYTDRGLNGTRVTPGFDLWRADLTGITTYPGWEVSAEWLEEEPVVACDFVPPERLTLEVAGNPRTAAYGTLWQTSTGYVHRSLQCRHINGENARPVPAEDVLEDGVVKGNGIRACTTCFPSAPTRRTARVLDDPCTACGGWGVQAVQPDGTHWECYLCDGSGDGDEERRSRAAGMSNANPESGLLVGEDQANGILPVTAKNDGRFKGVSLKQDDDGWYVTTHRARSKSYPTPEDIPQAKVDFIESTGALQTVAYQYPDGRKLDDEELARIALAEGILTAEQIQSIRASNKHAYTDLEKVLRTHLHTMWARGLIDIGPFHDYEGPDDTWAAAEERASAPMAIAAAMDVTEAGDLWGGDVSMEITDTAYALLGLGSGSRDEDFVEAAQALIDGAKPFSNTVYHGVGGFDPSWRRNSQVKIALMATSPDLSVAEGFQSPFGRPDDDYPTAVLVFNGGWGVPLHARETVLTGRYRITSIEDDPKWGAPHKHIHLAPISQKVSLRSEARGPLDTPATAYGLRWDPAVASSPLVAEAREWDGWDSLPVTSFDLGTPLYATEEVLSSASISKVVDGGEPFRQGYYAQIAIDPQGRHFMADGNHRAAMYLARGERTMPARILDLRTTKTASVPALERFRVAHVAGKSRPSREEGPLTRRAVAQCRYGHPGSIEAAERLLAQAEDQPKESRREHMRSIANGALRNIERQMVTCPDCSDAPAMVASKTASGTALPEGLTFGPIHEAPDMGEGVMRVSVFDTTNKGSSPVGRTVGQMDWVTVQGGGRIESAWIDNVYVDLAWRRKGVASAMLAFARQECGYPIEHSTMLTADGEAWARRVGSKAEGITYRIEWPLKVFNGPNKGGRVHAIDSTGREVGNLSWTVRPDDGFGIIGYVEVDEAHQRQGIASEMLRRARARCPVPIKHSDNLSTDGRGWSQAVGALASATAARRATAAMPKTREEAEALIATLPPEHRDGFMKLWEMEHARATQRHDGRWFHASPASLRPGDVLRPGGGPVTDPGFYDAQRGQDEAMGLPPRDSLIWISPDEADVDFWAGVIGAAHVYEVEPVNPRPWGISGADGHVCDTARVIRRISVQAAKQARFNEGDHILVQRKSNDGELARGVLKDWGAREVVFTDGRTIPQDDVDMAWQSGPDPKTAMADRSGIPEVDALIEAFLREPLDEREWGPTNETVEHLRHPENSHGVCQIITAQFVEFAKARGFKAYSTDTDLAEMGYRVQRGAPKGEIGFDENDEMQFGHYDEHTVCTLAPPSAPGEWRGQWSNGETGEIYVDFSASQYGYKDHPKVTSSKTAGVLEWTGDPSIDSSLWWQDGPDGEPHIQIVLDRNSGAWWYEIYRVEADLSSRMVLDGGPFPTVDEAERVSRAKAKAYGTEARPFAVAASVVVLPDLLAP